MAIEPKFEREMVDLSGFWHFKIDPEKKGEQERWFELQSFKGWDRLYAPASWNEQDSKYTWYEGTAWYAREFYVPRDWNTRLALIGFEGVNYKAKVWVNGAYLGEHEGGFTPFAFRAETALKFGEPNRVAVMVDDTLTKKTVPPGEGMNQTYFDFFQYGGIQREVYLMSVPKLHIKDVTIRTDIQGNDGVVDIDVTVLNGHDARLFCKLTLQVFDEGAVTPEKPVRVMIAPKSEKTINDRILIRAAEFWSVESPHLYTLRTSVSYEETEADMKDTRFGIRTVRVEKGKILLNGRPVFLKGCCRHEDFPVLGKTLHGAVLRRDYGLMKELGCNSFRTSHYPYSRSHLDLADENGFLIILEMPTSGFRAAIERFDDPEIIEKVRRMTREAIQRDKNRPSVIMYSLFNEPDSEREDFRILFKEVKEEATKADPTRPITFASHRHLNDLALDMVDVLCHNFYYGWYTLCGELDKARTTLSETLDEIHKKYPDKPLIVTEFGADAIAGVHRDPPEMWSEEYQAEMIRLYWEVLVSKDYVVGGHIWNFADFRTGQSPRRTTLNRKGIFTRIREPKLSVNVVKKLFTNTPTYK